MDQLRYELTASMPARWIAMLAIAAAGCGEAGADRSDPAPVRVFEAARPVRVVDSILPPEEALGRFREAIPEAPGRLTGGATSRGGLVRAFVAAVESADTLALTRMLVSRAEFAWLLFPESEFARPPYRQNPALVWFMMQNASAKGLNRVLARHGGRRLDVTGFRCDRDPIVQGGSRLWRGCTVTRAGPGGPEARRLFGTIVERGGVHKFLSYATDY
jgi:hypothetical protein